MRGISRNLSNFVLVLAATVLLQAHPTFSKPVQYDSQTQPHDRAWKVGQEVKTTSGVVVGHASKNRTEVSEYLGIPFAKPPVGPLRWAAPQKYNGTGVINASSFSGDCAATFQDPNLALGIENPNPSGLVLLTEMMQLGHPVTEDCLTLNVWTKPQSGSKSKAVLFWIYGGGFATGNSANTIYDGQFFADNEDVVVVSINYRLNIFGFPGLPGIDGVEQNPGLLDQRLALEWARDNVAAFGGDPNRITIFGESAGGASVDYYSYAYTKDPIVSGIIAESGAVSSFSSPAPPNNSEVWYKASAALGCPTSAAAASVACMRTKSMDEILKATKVANPLQAVLGFFGPSVDGKTVFGDYKERAAAGNFIQKPYMTGNNHLESGLFILIASGARLNITANIWPVFNAATFTCPIARAAAARASKGVPTYRYRYFADFPNTFLQDSNKGAYHTAEIPLVFGTTEYVTGQANTPSQAKLQKFMQSTWAAFAKDPLSLQKSPFNLPAYDAKNEFAQTLIGLGAYESSTHALLAPIGYDMFCEAIESITATIPGGIAAAIQNVAKGGDLGAPGLSASQLPDMSPAPLPALSTT